VKISVTRTPRARCALADFALVNCNLEYVLMRAFVLSLSLLIPFAAAPADLLSNTTAPSTQPLQMPDGSKHWRVSMRRPTHEQAENSIVDLIAQGLGNASWCENGWEETARTTPIRGFLLIEGRCK
jgi:hypothetical protein